MVERSPDTKIKEPMVTKKFRKNEVLIDFHLKLTDNKH